MTDSDRRIGRRARRLAPAAGVTLSAVAALALAGCAGGGSAHDSDRPAPTGPTSGAPSTPAGDEPAAQISSPRFTVPGTHKAPASKPGTACDAEGRYEMRLGDGNMYICRHGHWEFVTHVDDLPTGFATPG
ncbi:hypothetical protein ACZ90_01870 [Streptomyces albus subsp. albus]|nr:hypothetical protein ACZ90_01870 [Streptomyces albus subsp. albus]